MFASRHLSSAFAAAAPFFTYAISGAYTAINPTSDIWPGVILALSANNTTTNVMVRKVTVEDGHAAALRRARHLRRRRRTGHRGGDA